MLTWSWGFSGPSAQLESGRGVGPRHRGISSGGNETHFRPAGGLKNIVYEIRGAFDRYYFIIAWHRDPGGLLCPLRLGPPGTWTWPARGASSRTVEHKEPIQSKIALGPLKRHMVA